MERISVRCAYVFTAINTCENVLKGRVKMRAVCWNGPRDVRVQNVPDPTIVNPHDAVVKITTTAICGSDLHLYNGYIPTMRRGDILGHEFMGEVVDVGRD